MTEEPTITLDLASLTLGEIDYVERLSGRSFSDILRTTAGKLMMAQAVMDLRTYPASESSEKRRSWQELSGLRLRDVSRSISQSSRASRSAKSND